MSTSCIPLEPELYIVKLGYTGVYIFSYFCSKILLINVKMPTIAGIFTFISRYFTGFGILNLELQYIWAISVFVSSLNFSPVSPGLSIKVFLESRAMVSKFWL